MLWPDMLWFWIIAYDLWNFAYVYNCVPDHSFYAGAALLISCTIPAFFIKKGAWLQHRAQTLAIWMMFVMCLPGFVDTSKFAVKSSHNPKALFLVSLLALGSNVAVAIYNLYKIRKNRLNPLTDELHTDLPGYRAVVINKLEF
jgi:membrane protein YdbS with pleckstrin-like domain